MTQTEPSFRESFFHESSFRDSFISAVLTLGAVLCMAYAAIGLAAVLLPQWSPWFCLFFCVLCGILHTIGVCAGESWLSLRQHTEENSGGSSFAFTPVLAVLLLSILFFHSWQASGEILAGAAVYALFYLLQRYDRPRQAAVAGLCLALAACHFLGRTIPVPLAAACLLAVLIELAGAPLHPRHEHGLQLIPFLLLLEAAILLLPASDEPFDWSFVMRIGERAADLAQNVIVDMEYRFSSRTVSSRWNTGYGNGDLFGGRLSVDNRVELSLSDAGTRQVIYLAGEEYADFDGSRWTEGSADNIPYIGWYLTFLNNLDQRQVTPEKAACFAKKASVEITYRYLRTTDVIRPATLLRIDNSVRKKMTGDDGSFSFQKSQSRGFGYGLTFMDLDYASPYLVNILRDAGYDSSNNNGSSDDYGNSNNSSESIPSYDQLDAASRRLFDIPLPSLISDEDYEAKAESIFHPDLTAWLDTGNTPERVAQLARQITEQEETPYDKCAAIERYLRQYPYSRDVDYRNYVNFVDAFLFEKQQGYCIHYASAMVMMLRSLGIPARLVEGYRYDYGVPQDNGYDIPGRYAHTWPEAWLDGFGWVRFEPTGSVASAEAYGWNLLAPGDTPLTAAAAGNGDGGGDGGTGDGNGAASPADAGDFGATPPITESSDSEERANPFGIWLFFAAWIPVLYLLLLLIIRPVFMRCRYHGIKVKEPARLGRELADILWLTRHICPDANGNRPLLDYAVFVPDAGDAEAMRRVCLAYYRLRYLGGNVEPDLWQTSLRLRQSLYRQYTGSAKCGRIRRRLLTYISLKCPLR